MKGLCERAADSQSYGEWWGRLTVSQRALVTKIEPLLKSGLSTEPEVLLPFFANVDVEVWPLEHVEQSMAPYWMPESNRHWWSLFDLLRGRVGGKARRRGWFTRFREAPSQVPSARLRLRNLRGVEYRDLSCGQRFGTPVQSCGMPHRDQGLSSCI